MLVNDKIALLERFYTAFRDKDVETMIDCYHPDLIFNDPVFQQLSFEQTAKMWRYLIGKGGSNMTISFSVLNDHEVNWEAIYLFSKTGRKVHNKIRAKIQYKEGKIFRHDDNFNFWKWSAMALGFPGYLLGWSPMLKTKVRKSVSFIVAD